MNTKRIPIPYVILILLFFSFFAPSISLAQTVLSNGTPINSLSGDAASQKTFMIYVPPAQGKLEIKIYGGTGDCDLYVKRGSIPTTTSYDYRCPSGKPA
jgi:hypothetical protein